MPQINCKHCGQTFVPATISGTMFCPHCRKAFWITGESAPRTTARMPAPAPSAAPRRRESLVAIACISGAGLLMLLCAAALLMQHPYEDADPENSAEVPIGVALSREPEWRRLQIEIGVEEGKLRDIEDKISELERVNVRLQSELEAYMNAQPQAPAPPPPPPQVETPPAITEKTQQPDVLPIIKAASKSVVVVFTSEGGGTGFVVSKDGIIVTNQHVVGRFDKAQVEIQTNSSTDKVRLKGVPVIARDEDADLALLRLPGPPENVAVNGGYPFVPVREAETKTGEEVFAIGNPGLTLDYTVTRGIISNPNRILANMNLIQTTAAINHGNSGGPLFDIKGSVVGVNTLKHRTLETVAFAIPSTELRRLLERYEVKFKLR